MTTVRLGEREFDLDTEAYNIYRTVSGCDKAKLLRLIRRVRTLNKTRWTKQDFVMEIDEKQRVSIRLGQFLEEGDRLKSEIHLEAVQRELAGIKAELAALEDPGIAQFHSALRATIAKPGPLSVTDSNLARLFTATPTSDLTYDRMRMSVTEWRRKVADFLALEKPGHAPEFQMSIEFPKGQLADIQRLDVEITELVVRLIDIKRRAEM